VALSIENSELDELLKSAIEEATDALLSVGGYAMDIFSLIFPPALIASAGVKAGLKAVKYAKSAAELAVGMVQSNEDAEAVMNRFGMKSMELFKLASHYFVESWEAWSTGSPQDGLQLTVGRFNTKSITGKLMESKGPAFFIVHRNIFLVGVQKGKRVMMPVLPSLCFIYPDIGRFQPRYWPFSTLLC